MKRSFSFIDLTKKHIPQDTFSTSVARNTLLLLLGMLFINVSPTFGQSKDSLIEIVCNSLHPTKYKVLNHTFSISEEFDEGKAFESAIFPIIKEGNLIANSFSDLLGEEIDFRALNDDIKRQVVYPITTNCKLKTFQKHPSKSKKHFSVKISNPVILSGKNKTIGILLIRSNSNNYILSPLTVLLFEWNEESWIEIKRQELEFHD